jgi:hypothetical protein
VAEEVLGHGRESSAPLTFDARNLESHEPRRALQRHVGAALDLENGNDRPDAVDHAEAADRLFTGSNHPASGERCRLIAERWGN